MHYAECSPPTDLAPLVRCFWQLTDDGEVAGPSAEGEPALPDGSPELIWVLGDPFEHVGDDGTVTPQPPAFLVGQITRPLTVRPTGRVALMAVRFEAHGASILHPMLRDLTDRWIESSRLSHPNVHRLGAALAATDSAERRVQLAAEALRGVAARAAALPAPRPDPRVAAAVRAIRDSHGLLALDELARSLSVAPRTLQRLFATQVGISPKHLARIVRFQRVFAAWRDDRGSLARVAAQCGYFDQSHLVRDFQELAGMPPTTLMGALPAFTGFFLP